MSADGAKRSRGRSKREQIGLAATKVFVEQGYGAASMDAIAERAEVTKATVYAYFESKEILFKSMVAEYCDAQRREIEALEAERPGAEEGLFRMAQVMMRYWSNPGALQFSRMIFGEAVRFPELGRSFVETAVQSMQRVVADFLQDATKRGEIDVQDPDLVAEIFIAMIRGPVQMRSLLALGKPPETKTLKTIAREAARMIVATYEK